MADRRAGVDRSYRQVVEANPELARWLSNDDFKTPELIESAGPRLELRVQQPGHRRCIRTDDGRRELAQRFGRDPATWSEFDPHVEPLAMVEEDGDKVRVTVHQLVKSLRGAVLPDSEVLHVFHCEQRPYRGHGPRGSDRSDRWSVCRVRSSILIRFGAGFDTTSFATTGNSAQTYYPPDLRRLLKSPRILFWGPGRT